MQKVDSAAIKPIVLIYEPYIFNVYGNTRYLLSIFKYYDRRRYRIILCSPYEHPFLDQIRALGGECRIVPPPEELVRYGGAITSGGLFDRIKTLRAIIQNGRALMKLMSDERADVIQCHSIRSLVTIGWFARLLGKPCFWYVKGDLANGLLDRLGFLLASRIYFQSPLTRDRKYPLLRKFFKRKIDIIPNGIDLAETDSITAASQESLSRELGIEKGVLNIGVIGQISPLKGSDRIVEALIELRKSGMRFRCYFVGDHVLKGYDEFYASLHARAVRELPQQVVFLGWRADATAILSLMDILVHASLSEGVPKAVLEAMALGVPVIATNVGGTAELIVDGHNGALIAPGSSETILRALQDLATDKAKRDLYAGRSREIAHEKYSVTDNVKRLEHVYDQLAAS